MWLALALISAFASAFVRVYEKNLSADFGNFSLGFATKAFSLAPLLVLCLFLPMPESILDLSWNFWWPLIVIWLVLYPVQTYFLYRAIREGELSQVIPVLALLPVFNIGTSYVLINELPTLMGAAGIVVIVIGVFLLLTDTEQKEEQRWTLNMPVLFMAVAAFAIAIGSTLDKIALQEGTTAFYAVMNTFGAAVVFFVLIFIYQESGDLRKVRAHAKQLLIYGVVYSGLYLTAMSAFLYAPTSYSLAVRSGSFLLAAVWGIVFLSEKFSRRKMASFGLFIAGLVLITL